MAKKWTRHDWIKIFEYLIDRDCNLLSSNKFRQHLGRDENLIANQITREATSNCAYRSIDQDITKMSDEEIWQMLDGSKFNEVIEDNAASAIVTMAEKFELLKN